MCFIVTSWKPAERNFVGLSTFRTGNAYCSPVVWNREFVVSNGRSCDFGSRSGREKSFNKNRILYSSSTINTSRSNRLREWGISLSYRFFFFELLYWLFLLNQVPGSRKENSGLLLGHWGACNNWILRGRHTAEKE